MGETDSGRACSARSRRGRPRTADGPRRGPFNTTNSRSVCASSGRSVASIGRHRSEEPPRDRDRAVGDLPCRRRRTPGPHRGAGRRDEDRAPRSDAGPPRTMASTMALSRQRRSAPIRTSTSAGSRILGSTRGVRTSGTERSLVPFAIAWWKALGHRVRLRAHRPSPGRRRTPTRGQTPLDGAGRQPGLPVGDPHHLALEQWPRWAVMNSKTSVTTTSAGSLSTSVKNTTQIRGGGQQRVADVHEPRRTRGIGRRPGGPTAPPGQRQARLAKSELKWTNRAPLSLPCLSV